MIMVGKTRMMRQKKNCFILHHFLLLFFLRNKKIVVVFEILKKCSVKTVAAFKNQTITQQDHINENLNIQQWQRITIIY